MLSNYLKVALRALLRQRLYGFINVFGLGLGIACCLLLGLFVADELTFDRVHEDGDRIFRIARVSLTPEGAPDGEKLTPYMPIPAGPALKADLPEVEDFVRFKRFDLLVRRGAETVEEEVVFADPSVLEVFTFPLITGDAATALAQPNAVVLSEAMARRYFGEEDPLGQPLEIRFEGRFEPFVVTGVAAVPSNSTVRFEMLAPFERTYDAFPRMREGEHSFDWSSTLTYVRLREGAEIGSVEAKMPAFIEAHYGEHIEAMRSNGYWTGDGPPLAYHFQPLPAIHLDPHVRPGLTPPSNPLYAQILAAIALAVLLIACINFMTLAIGRSARRAKEVGVRKTMGAQRGQLLGQFWGEALLMSALGLVVGLALAALFLPTFNALTGKALSFGLVPLPLTLGVLAGLVLVTGLAAGSYPALLLARLDPVASLKQRVRLGGSNAFARALVVVQFALSVFLLTGTFVLGAQLRYVQERDLGYEREHVAVVPVDEAGNRDALARLRTALAGNAAVTHLTGASLSFGRGTSSYGFQHEGEQLEIVVYEVESDFVEAMGMDLLAGRDFDPALASDSTDAVIVNEALVRALGLAEPVGARLPEDFEWNDNGAPSIIGVVRDFHFRSLHEEVEPALLMLAPADETRYALARLAPGRTRDGLDAIEAAWAEVAPGLPLEVGFLDEDLAAFYENELRWAQIVRWATLFALAVACLGLFGLSSLTVAQRTKEIGIRKVLGATAPDIAALLSKGFAALVAVAVLIAAPLAWLAAERWLGGFAYRVVPRPRRVPPRGRARPRRRAPHRRAAGAPRRHGRPRQGAPLRIGRPQGSPLCQPRPTMLKYHVAFALRSLFRRKGYAALNVAGLAVGMASCLLIGLYISDELSYDRFHEHAGRIAVVGFESGFFGRTTSTPYPLGPTLAAELPEVERAVRTAGPRMVTVVGDGDSGHEQRALRADPGFFEVFDGFRLLRGDPATALEAPGAAVLSEPTARFYFGDGDPLGRTLEVVDRDSAYTVMVSGVAEVPPNSTLQFDLVLPLATLPASSRPEDGWGMLMFGTYLLSRDDVAGEALTAKVQEAVGRHEEERAGDFFAAPFTSLYLSDLHRAEGFAGEQRYLYIFGSIALFVLLIAAINYVNLVTAQATKRAREVGVRKTLGASRMEVARQFGIESGVTAAVALAAALGLVAVLLPGFNALFEKDIALGGARVSQALLALGAFVFAVSLAAGAYPALVLSRFEPVRVMRGRSGSAVGGAGLRKGLVIAQFAITVVLIAGTVTIYEQLRFMQSKNLGFDGEQVAVVELPEEGAQVHETLRAAVAAEAGVAGASVASAAPGRFRITLGIPPDAASAEAEMAGEEAVSFSPALVDADFAEVLGLRVLAGRTFSHERDGDARTYVLNEASARALGWSPEEAVGKLFRLGGESDGEVIGVVEDFHTASLRNEIGPVVLQAHEPEGWSASSLLLVRFHPDDLPRSLRRVEEVVGRYTPEEPFEYAFLDDTFDAMYRAEERLAGILASFAGLAVFVACLGLFGLAAYAAERRTKEVGIRKVLGASVPALVSLLTREFFALVLVGFAVAVPVAYGLMSRWLEDFAFRVEMGPGVFALAGLLAFAIALATVSYHALRAATADPVKSLRYE